MERNAFTFQIVGQQVFGEARQVHIQVDGNQVEMDWCTRLQDHQDIQQGITVLASRHADHDPVAFLNHVVVFHRLASKTEQTL